MEDQTKPGHCLGPAANRSLVPAPERTMSPAGTALVRLLVHLGLYLGANTRLEEIHSLITPTIRQNDVPDFLWEHMLCDLEVLSRAVGKGKDDTLLLVHLLIREISLCQDKRPGYDGCLDSKKVRSTWETQFSEVFITPILSELDARLTAANQEMTKDSRKGNNILRRVIYETNMQKTNSEGGVDYQRAPAVWRFRTRVSIEHVTQALSENMAVQTTENEQTFQQHMVLQLFLKQESMLRVVQLIPNILEFVKILGEVYHRKVDRKEADELTVGHFFESNHYGETRQKFEALFSDFQTAWIRVHPYLHLHVFLRQVLPAEYSNQEISYNTPLSTFLPSHRGRGLCTVALLHYLTTVHNNFMAEYCRITGKKPRQEVTFTDLTPAHLITYDPDRDLLPLVMANCTYSLEVGQGTKIGYNFKQLEQQLEERFIKGRGLLKFQLRETSFREDLNNAALCKSLQMKIKQVPFSSAVQNQIRGDARIMVDVSDCLGQLDIAIGFLVSIGGQPDTTLHSFMMKTLQMHPGALTPMASQHCRLCHTQALWLLFSHEREKMVLKNKQEPFTAVDSRKYKAPLSNDQRENVRTTALPRMNVDLFLNELHECILLHITIEDDPNDEVDTDKSQYGLGHVLAAYIEGKEGPEIAAQKYGTFPADIKVEQCVDTWRVACQYMQGNGNK